MNSTETDFETLRREAQRLLDLVEGVAMSPDAIRQGRHVQQLLMTYAANEETRARRSGEIRGPVK